MNPSFNLLATKKLANVSINGDLLAQAKALKINLSATLEHALIQKLSVKQRENWQAENKVAIEAYNQLVEKHGIFSDDLRTF
jgi:antitoxin CcdA